MDATEPHTLSASNCEPRHKAFAACLCKQLTHYLLLFWGPWALCSLLIFCHVASPAPLVKSCLFGAFRALLWAVLALWGLSISFLFVDGRGLAPDLGASRP